MIAGTLISEANEGRKVGGTALGFGSEGLTAGSPLKGSLAKAGDFDSGALQTGPVGVIWVTDMLPKMLQ